MKNQDALDSLQTSDQDISSNLDNSAHYYKLELLKRKASPKQPPTCMISSEITLTDIQYDNLTYAVDDGQIEEDKKAVYNYCLLKSISPSKGRRSCASKPGVGFILPLGQLKEILDNRKTNSSNTICSDSKSPKNSISPQNKTTNNSIDKKNLRPRTYTTAPSLVKTENIYPTKSKPITLSNNMVESPSTSNSSQHSIFNYFKTNDENTKAFVQLKKSPEKNLPTKDGDKTEQLPVKYNKTLENSKFETLENKSFKLTSKSSKPSTSIGASILLFNSKHQPKTEKVESNLQTSKNELNNYAIKTVEKINSTQKEINTTPVISSERNEENLEIKNASHDISKNTSADSTLKLTSFQHSHNNNREYTKSVSKDSNSAKNNEGNTQQCIKSYVDGTFKDVEEDEPQDIRPRTTLNEKKLQGLTLNPTFKKNPFLCNNVKEIPRSNFRSNSPSNATNSSIKTPENISHNAHVSDLKHKFEKSDGKDSAYKSETSSNPSTETQKSDERDTNQDTSRRNTTHVSAICSTFNRDYDYSDQNISKRITKKTTLNLNDEETPSLLYLETKARLKKTSNLKSRNYVETNI
ncbi:hypothetical protein HZS_3975 [Henneguya salminicola]|nr:hypothetical protein HZS_3975 [Henneguya salminicola]